MNIVLIFPTQLFKDIDLLQNKQVYLIEEPIYFTNYNYHKLPASMGIYAIQRKTEAFFPLDINDLSTGDFLSDFQGLMNEVVTQIFDETIPFTHTATAKYCGYC